jgi:uncharacterized protein (TIGR03790 family)
MKKPARIAAALLALAGLAALPRAIAEAPPREVAATAVVFNNLDASSVELASYYAKRRGIPPDHLVGLNCSLSEEITRADYDSTIANPLRKIFSDRGWWHMPEQPELAVTYNQIRFIALIRGIPLKIAAAPGYPGDSFTGPQQALDTNAASVDSELAMLGIRTTKISGPFKNFYFNRYTPFIDAPLAPIMLVCRLDAPTPAIVRNMIDGALAAERTGLDGFAYIDIRGITSGPFAEGDKWLATAAVSLRHHGMPLVWDSSPELFPVDFPMDHAAIYLGWYAGSVTGPMARDDFRFVPGAIAVHIHSFSALTLRDPKAFWCAPLLAHGAAATLGNVYEPYLALTSHLDIFADRLRNGFNFAEAAYASQPVLSWMTTFIGDPLYRPFQNTGESADGGDRPAIEYAAYRKGAQTWYESGRPAGEKRLMASARELQSGIVWEGLGLLQWSVLDYNAAMESFRQAQHCYGKTEDGARTALHQVEILKSTGKLDQARALAAKSLKTYSAFHGAALFRADISSPASSTPAK